LLIENTEIQVLTDEFNQQYDLTVRAEIEAFREKATDFIATTSARTAYASAATASASPAYK
jgi:hypothetical protein